MSVHTLGLPKARSGVVICKEVPKFLYLINKHQFQLDISLAYIKYIEASCLKYQPLCAATMTKRHIGVCFLSKCELLVHLSLS